MLFALTAVLLGTLASNPNGSSMGSPALGAGHLTTSSAASVAKMYDLAPTLPWRADSAPDVNLLPYLAGGRADGKVDDDPMSGADSVLQGLRTITGKEFEYEGRELRVDDSGRLLVKAPAALHELTARYLEFLEGALGATSELAVDVFTLPEGVKDIAVESIIPVADIAKIAAVAEQGGSRRTYRIQTRPGITARLDATRATRLVSDYNIEIAQASTIADPIVDDFAAGLRLYARTAPGQGGTWLALILRQGEQVGDIETHDAPLENLINSQDHVNLVAGPHLFQTVDVENRSLALNTFIPDGKALVVRSSHECKNARPSELVVVRQTGRPLPSALRFRADAKSAGPGDDLLLLNTQGTEPPRCALEGSLSKGSGVWAGWALARGSDPILGARFAEENSDMAIEMLQPLDAWGTVESLSAWLLLARDPGRASSEANAPPGSATGEDPAAILARCAPASRVVQVSIALKRNSGPAAQSTPGTQAIPAASDVIARWVLPLRTGAASCAVLGRESTEVGDYDVEVAQLAGGADPQIFYAFDGLALTLKPDVTSSGDITLDLTARAHVKNGDTREFDPRVPTLGRMQQSTYDQLSTREKLVFARSDGPRRVVLGDAAGAAGSLTLEVEVVP